MSDYVYEGSRSGGGWTVERTCRDPASNRLVTGRLPMMLELVDHERRGFAWGAWCGATLQLAFALAYDATRDEWRARRVHAELCWILSTFDADTGWRIGRGQVLDWIREIEAELDDADGLSALTGGGPV